MLKHTGMTLTSKTSLTLLKNMWVSTSLPLSFSAALCIYFEWERYVSLHLKIWDTRWLILLSLYEEFNCKLQLCDDYGDVMYHISGRVVVLMDRMTGTWTSISTVPTLTPAGKGVVFPSPVASKTLLWVPETISSVYHLLFPAPLSAS